MTDLANIHYTSVIYVCTNRGAAEEAVEITIT